MTLLDSHNLLDFYINKAQGAYLSPEEKDEMLHVWQISLYSDYQEKKGTGSGIENSLSPFKNKFFFLAVNTPLGVLTMPNDYFDIIDVQVDITINSNPISRPVDFPNDDERAYRLGSQLIPNTVNDPFGEVTALGVIQLYPKTPQAGTATYYRLPVRPKFVYTTISGRIITYDPVNSIQLEWSDKDINTIVIRALTGIGINISAEDVLKWADGKASVSENGPMKI